MKWEKMNCSQKLASLISGYGGGENGAKDDGYYECSGDREKWNYLVDCVLARDDITGKADILGVREFLEEDFSADGGDVERYHAFMELKTN